MWNWIILYPRYLTVFIVVSWKDISRFRFYCFMREIFGKFVKEFLKRSICQIQRFEPDLWIKMTSLDVTINILSDEWMKLYVFRILYGNLTSTQLYISMDWIHVRIYYNFAKSTKWTIQIFTLNLHDPSMMFEVIHTVKSIVTWIWLWAGFLNSKALLQDHLKIQRLKFWLQNKLQSHENRLYHKTNVCYRYTLINPHVPQYPKPLKRLTLVLIYIIPKLIFFYFIRKLILQNPIKIH